MKAAMASADMVETAQTKNPSSRYFRPRNGISSQRGSRKLRRKSFRPACHKYSDSVHTGHSQLQNALRNRNAIERNVIMKNMVAGCIAGTGPVSNEYQEYIEP